MKKTTNIYTMIWKLSLTFSLILAIYQQFFVESSQLNLIIILLLIVIILMLKFFEYAKEMINLSSDTTDLSSITKWIGSVLILNFARFLKIGGCESIEEQLIQSLADGALAALSSWKEFMEKN